MKRLRCTALPAGAGASWVIPAPTLLEHCAMFAPDVGQMWRLKLRTGRSHGKKSRNRPTPGLTSAANGTAATKTVIAEIEQRWNYPADDEIPPLWMRVCCLLTLRSAHGKAEVRKLLMRNDEGHWRETTSSQFSYEDADVVRWHPWPIGE